MDKKTFEDALKIIEEYETIIIHRHMNPDGDALGSQVGLGEIIKDNFPGKKVYLVGDESDRYGFICQRAMDSVDDSLFPLSWILPPHNSSVTRDGEMPSAPYASTTTFSSRRYAASKWWTPAMSHAQGLLQILQEIYPLE